MARALGRLGGQARARRRSAADRRRIASLGGQARGRSLLIARRIVENMQYAAAASRLRLDRPSTAYFSDPATGLRIDLLFDFPVPAADLARHATRTTIRSRVFSIASPADCLRLKQIAKANRSAPGDAEDIASLKARRR